jgi:hypothetical protein
MLFIKNHYNEINYLAYSIITIISIICCIKIKNKTLNIYKFLTLLCFVLIVLILNFLINKTVPKYQVKHCFTIKNKIIKPEPKEEWHKTSDIRDVEYLVLKVGKKNYLVHSTIPSLEDFPFSKDIETTESNCLKVLPNE